MGFGQAVGSAFKRYFDFSTRSSRSEFWWFQLFIAIVYFVLMFFVGDPTDPNSMGYTLAGIFYLAVLIPIISVGVRRLHDIDKSGWLYLVYIIPLIGFIMMIVWGCTRGTAGPNRFGDDPLDPSGNVGEVFE